MQASTRTDQNILADPQPTRAIFWWWLIPLAAILALGMALRFWHIGQQSLWFDEGYTAWVVGQPAGRIVEIIRNDVSPPLYYLVLSLWQQCFGNSETSLRSMSAVAGSLSLIVMAALAWRITRSRVGTCVAVVLFAVSVLQVQYAQEARSYGVASFLALVSLYAAARRLERPHAWRWLALIAAATAACVYLHNMMWFYAAGLNAAFLLLPGQVKTARRLLELFLLNMLVLIAYLPWLPVFLEQIAWLKGNFWATVPTADDLWQVMFAVGGVKRMHLVGALGPRPWLSGLLGLLLAGLALLPLVRWNRRDIRMVAGLLAYGALPILAVFIYASKQSFFVEKVFTASTLSLPLLAGLGVSGKGRLIAWPLILALLAGSAVSLWGYFQWEKKEDWRSAVTYVNGFPRQTTLVVFVANEGELLYEYYTNRQGAFAHHTAAAPQGFHELEPPRTIQRVMKQADTEKLAQRIREADPQCVLLVHSHWMYSDPKRFSQAAIARNMHLVSSRDFNWIDVEEYVR